MRRWEKILYTVVLLTLSACAARVPEPEQARRPEALETLVASDVEATWNTLVSQLRGRDFEINAADKRDGTIRVLVRSAIPSSYVDCGNISVRSHHPQFGTRNYDFPAANSARYLVADGKADELVDVERRTSLNAIADIQLTPVGQSTMVRVGAQYVMNFRTREFGRVDTRSLDSTLDFKSFGSASAKEEIRVSSGTKTVTVECRPTGALERRLVEAVQKTAG